ncbi:MAG: ROK family protein [Rhodoglobus sp.]
MKIGIDIGGTKTAAVLIDENGTILHEVVVPTGYGATEVIASAMRAVDELTGRAGIDSASLSSIGVGIPGVVDAATGIVSHAVNLGLHSVELGRELAQRTNTRVDVENDVNAAAVGMFHAIDDDSVDSLAYLNLGTGLAAGLVLYGKLWRGSRGTAGEIGHIPVDPSGPICACGQRGCLELSASGSAVSRLWPGDHPRPLEALFAAADTGDAAALAAQAKLIDNIAAAVRVLVLSIDVDVVVIGGGMSALGDPLILAVRQTLDRWAIESPFLASLALSDRVRLAPTGFPAAAVGAALMAPAQ